MFDIATGKISEDMRVCDVWVAYGPGFILSLEFATIRYVDGSGRVWLESIGGLLYSLRVRFSNNCEKDAVCLSRLAVL